MYFTETKAFKKVKVNLVKDDSYEFVEFQCCVVFSFIHVTALYTYIADIEGKVSAIYTNHLL